MNVIFYIILASSCVFSMLVMLYLSAVEYDSVIPHFLRLYFIGMVLTHIVIAPDVLHLVELQGKAYIYTHWTAPTLAISVLYLIRGIEIFLGGDAY